MRRWSGGEERAICQTLGWGRVRVVGVEGDDAEVDILGYDVPC